MVVVKWVKDSAGNVFEIIVTPTKITVELL
jgi:hypothetical protein